MKFSDLPLSPPILKAIHEEGYDEPSPIQQQAIPAVLGGRDVMAAAQTGTGKTAGFTLPILEKLSESEAQSSHRIRALILTPTRELAAQVGEAVAAYGKHTSLRSAVVFGGVKINPQIRKLKAGCDILVATPGRLLDLHSQGAVQFNRLEFFVLDEADRMLDMGFIHDIKKVIAALPARRQNLLFSATFSDPIRKLAKGIVHKPIEVSVSPRNTTAETVQQSLYSAGKSQRASLLVRLFKENGWKQVLVFVRTKHGANRLARQLESKGIKSAAIHGDKGQGARTRALEGFKNGQLDALVATDIAARGIDIDQLPQVVNFDLPDQAEDYVHRIGRTGRAGAAGQAISLVCAEQFPQLVDIENLIKTLIPRVNLQGFEPSEVLPETRLGMRSPKRPPKKTPQRGKRLVKGGEKNSEKKGGTQKKFHQRRRGKGSMAAQKRSSHNK
ncbi:DEAD/DEAH box helicase [Rubritalea tangerina]|uniref:DEAD/DEAH box helicase n=1 Tax=Rubritalea tangerina TaxID=430798 RepID=A0ABW4Z8C7_9BACT